MEIRRVRDSVAHKEALGEIERLWGAPTGSPERERLGVLADLVELYETRYFDVPRSDPVEILEYAISEMGRSQKELGQILGSSSRASEIMKRKRALTIDMIDKISRAWHIPVAALANPYPLAPGSERRSQGARPSTPSEPRERARVPAGKQARS
jgi:HTH-type transcriptional regulator / antitoxin HigA